MKIFLVVVCLIFLPVVYADNSVYQFTASDKVFLSQFSLHMLPSLPEAPSNSVADSIEAALLGKQIFFDSRFSKNNAVSCASCHKPELYFTDGLPQSIALGIARRSAPTLLGAQWSPWLFWDGRKDSLWSQALGPIEHPGEHGFNRAEAVAVIKRYYRRGYQSVFGALPEDGIFTENIQAASPLGAEQSKARWDSFDQSEQDSINQVFSNIGKALMAYQRQLKIPPSRFDQFVHSLATESAVDKKALLSETEVAGLRLFMGKANCASCHNGPLFTNFEFHNIGAPEADILQVDMGRFDGVVALLDDEFTCLSPWSDADDSQCEEIAFLKRKGAELVGAFKTPTLRNVAATAPYMQSGQFESLEQVLNHYNTPTPPFYDRKQHPSRPHFDVLPLRLSDQEVQQLIAFLHTLTSPIPENDKWWNLNRM